MAHDIEVRKIPFEFNDSIDPVWHASRPEWSHMVNGASLTMPYLEPFLNRTMRDALEHIDDPDLRQDVDGFVRQEAQHYTNHRRYNEMLKANGYAELEEVEATFEAEYAALDARSLEWRLAYAAGFETMTMGVTEWLINDRELLFKDADPTIASFVLWHMVEETEHKSVAIDVYEAVCGRYWLRIAGLIWGSLHVGILSRRAYVVMLKKDGRFSDWRSRLRLWGMVGSFFLKGGSAMIRALLPNYHPDDVVDPAWIDEWRHAFSDGELKRGKAGFVPLLDTALSQIPPRFEAS